MHKILPNLLLQKQQNITEVQARNNLDRKIGKTLPLLSIADANNAV
jgi:hypothetical protein